MVATLKHSFGVYLLENDKAKYQIYDATMKVLPLCKNESDLKTLLEKSGIETEFKLRRTTGEVEGISFKYGNIAFKGSKIDRKFSFANLKKEFEKNVKAEEIRIKPTAEKQNEHSSERENLAVKKTGYIFGGIELTPEQVKILKEGGHVYLESMVKKDGTELSAYLFFDDKMTKPFFTGYNPESFVKYGKYEMRLMDKMRIEAGFITKAKVKWFGGIKFAHPYLWKVNKSDAEYKESWPDPRKLHTAPLQTSIGTIAESVYVQNQSEKDELKWKKKKGRKM